MSRFTTFLEKIKLPGVTSTTVAIALGEPDSYIWWGNTIYSRPTMVGFDTIQENFFTFSPLLGKKNAAIPSHLQKIRFMHEGKITNVDAARSYVHLWMQHLAKKKGIKGLHVVAGRYLIPSSFSEAQQQIYAQVFSQVPGSWSPLASGEALQEELVRVGMRQRVGTVLNLEPGRLDIFIFSEKELLLHRTLPMGTTVVLQEMDQKIREEYRVSVDQDTLVQLYTEVSKLAQLPSAKRVSIRGKDVATSLPKNVVVELESFADCVTQWLEWLMQEIRLAYSQLKPEVVAQVLPEMAVVGPGGDFRLIQTMVQEIFQMSVVPMEQPELALIKGARHVA